MNHFFPIAFIAIGLILARCSENTNAGMQGNQTITEQLKKISAVLQDSSFAVELAKKQDAAYYLAQQQTPPAFLTGTDDSIQKSYKEEKIAINIAGFYALECGIGVLIEQKGGTITEWLKKIIDGKIDSTELLVLNRFANATWKAGQPFRSLKRIRRDNFISAALLSTDEIKKDFEQVMAAAKKLLPAIGNAKDSSNSIQLLRLDKLLKDKQFAAEMAMHIEAAYYAGQQQATPLFLKPGEDTSTIKKSVNEDKIATNIAGFYALECGLSYLATAENRLPSGVLQSILNDSISNQHKRLFERFANATWKAGQPFRGLSRIERKIFTPFDLIPAEEIEKDWVQIKTAAELLKKWL